MNIYKIIKNMGISAFFFLIKKKLGIYKNISVESYLKKEFKAYMGKPLDLENPTTFNEKLQWLKLHDHNPQYTQMADKYEVKKYVAEKIGEEYVIPLLGVWENFDDIEFNLLPEQFVIKCTHDSGGVVICENKNDFDIDKTRKIINRSLRRNYYTQSKEWVYKNIKPRIIVEKYMKDSKLNELRDYKFFCFNGTPRCFKIDFNRSTAHQANYFDLEGNILPFGERYYLPDFNKKIEMPTKLEEMLRMATTLSEGIPFVRVDFYEVDGKIYFGEMTFYPGSGLSPYTDYDWDVKLGEWLELPKNDTEKIAKGEN